MPRPACGSLRIYLGYAAGVGKTYHMLVDAQELRADCVDVVIGYFEPHGRQDTIARTEGLEAIARQRIEYRGAVFDEMDTEAILRRKPEICLVDEFPHTNVPGSARAKRWEDVILILDAGIDVFTTMNIQHLESLNDQVWQITGIRVRETIPDWVMQRAAEVVMVDVTPRALLNRLERGVVYSREKAERAQQNFFRESTLVALRELALRQTAHEVENRRTAQAELEPLAVSTQTAPNRRPCILVHVDSDPQTAALVRRARRVGDFIGAECFAVYVQAGGSLDSLAAKEREAVERHLNFARNLHIETRILDGRDVAQTLVDFAHRNEVTQIYLARPKDKLHLPFFTSDLAQRIVELARDIEIVIVSERETAAGATVN